MLSVRAFSTSKHISGGIRGPMHAAHTPSVRDWLHSDVAAAEVPWMGDSMTVLFQNGALGAKVTIAIVGDGFAAGDQAKYNQAVDTLLANGLFTHDFWAANKSACNLLRVNLVSVDSGVGTKTYDAGGKVTNQVDRNTALGAYFNGDWAHCWVEDGPQTEDRLARALSIWVPDHRLVIVILNNPGFGGCTSGSRSMLPLGVTWSTYAHELGHLFGGLGDEYHQDTQTYTGDEPGQPNLTKNTNRSTVKWAGDIKANTPIPTGGDDYTPPKPAGWNDNQDVGLFEGGDGSYTHGVYHPVVNCRMKSNDPPYCPVCAAAMSAQIGPHLSGASERDAALETQGAKVGADDHEGYVRLVVRVDHGEPHITDAREVPGPLVQSETLKAGVVHELWVGDRRVSVGSHPDAGISRSFSEIGPEGPREHHIGTLDVYDLVVRVPVADLRGADPSSLSLNLVSLQAPFSGPLDNVQLQHNPALKTKPIFTERRIAAATLPDRLRQIMHP